MNKIIARKAKEEDLSTIQDLCNTLGEQSYSFDKDLSTTWASHEEGIKYYKERLSGEKGICFVAEKDGEIVGFASCTIHHPDGWRLVKRIEVDNLFIREHHRGEGIGKLLIDEIKTWGKEIDIQRVFLTAFSQNEKAIKFYKREGFHAYETILEFKLK